MAIVLSGTTNDILVNGVSVATDAEVSSAVASAVAPKANTADLKEIGVDQTWQNVTVSRAAVTTYTNSTGKPIFLAISVLNNSVTNAATFLQINNIVVAKNQNVFNGDIIGVLSAIVPNGATYKITASTLANIQLWQELR